MANPGQGQNARVEIVPAAFERVQVPALVTITDRARWVLTEYANAVVTEHDWKAWLSITVTLFSVLAVAGEYKSVLGLPPNVVQATFVLGAVLSAVRTVRALLRASQSKEQRKIE